MSSGGDLRCEGFQVAGIHSRLAGSGEAGSHRICCKRSWPDPSRAICCSQGNTQRAPHTPHGPARGRPQTDHSGVGPSIASAEPGMWKNECWQFAAAKTASQITLSVWRKRRHERDLKKNQHCCFPNLVKDMLRCNKSAPIAITWRPGRLKNATIQKAF